MKGRFYAVGEVNMKRISTYPKVNLHVPEPILRELQREAEYRSLTVSAVVREALNEKFKASRGAKPKA
jgi:Ribbon-helix-helix protein, copG family